MKFLFRWAFRLFILLLVLLVAALLLLDTIVRDLAENQIRSRTGMDVQIGNLSIGLLSPVITIENFKLYNTAEFGGSPLVDMPELHIEYDRRALFAHKIHCQLVRLDLAEVNVVQGKDGRINLPFLQPQHQNQHPPPGSGGGQTPHAKFKFTGIDTLNLTLGKATLVNMNNPSQVKEVPLNVHHRIIPGIRNAQDLQLRLLLILAQNGGANFLNVIPRN